MVYIFVVLLPKFGLCAVTSGPSTAKLWVLLLLLVTTKVTSPAWAS
jgi:hypothetical protein